ncbi:hypothetical protein RPPS3_25970 [Rhodopseudomonas palustris]|uniref:hypothetical protein n=1 Tax=Rhodopseudomonas palustris TaxID=1076 RepID=UPI000D213B05|nr:hypothetical protein [Rhodopseudomonas palustris]AVT76660.1 hypothetical protein RPPS3_25970 [Rhodopseudomonas palustris]
MIYHFQGLLETDARIIAEDDTYAVIAVRVAKATIARNLPFLAALGDLAPAAKPAADPLPQR